MPMKSQWRNITNSYVRRKQWRQEAEEEEKKYARSTLCSTPVHLSTTPCTSLCVPAYAPASCLRAAPIWTSSADGASMRMSSGGAMG